MIEQMLIGRSKDVGEISRWKRSTEGSPEMHNLEPEYNLDFVSRASLFPAINSACIHLPRRQIKQINRTRPFELCARPTEIYRARVPPFLREQMELANSTDGRRRSLEYLSFSLNDDNHKLMPYDESIRDDTFQPMPSKSRLTSSIERVGDFFFPLGAKNFDGRKKIDFCADKKTVLHKQGLYVFFGYRKCVL